MDSKFFRTGVTTTAVFSALSIVGCGGGGGEW